MSNSFEIGDLFEKASVKMLSLLFQEWGYKTDMHEPRRQKSGSQYGFDIYMRVYNDNMLPVHVFAECKGSKEFNQIDKYELAIKSDQHKRSPFPAKDVHLFFSPTRTINYANDEPPVEDDDNPFCVVDMMAPKHGQNSVLDLFLTYTGADEDILNYIDTILLPAVATKGYVPIHTFNETVAALKELFHCRLQAYLGKPKHTDFNLLTTSFWNKVQTDSNKDFLPGYFLRLDSAKERLLDVVANNYHIPNTKARFALLRRVKELAGQGGGLIKILANGGEGKSTFLLDAGKELSLEHPVFLIKHWKDDTLDKIQKQLSLLGEISMPVILLDDAATSEDALEQHGSKVANWSGGVILIVAERYYRYGQMECREAFESLFFNEPVQFILRSSENATEIFEKFFTLLRHKYPQLTNDDYIDSGRRFLSDPKLTIAEKIYTVLRYLHQNKRIVFPFDWDEWKKIHGNSSLEHLYLLVAAFYQFGNSITLDFCSQFSEYASLSKIEIRNAIDGSLNQPIIRSGEFLQLRHEKVAEWFIEDEHQQDNVKAIYTEWLGKVNSPFSKNLLLWTYRNNDFKKCTYLKGILSPEHSLGILKGFIEANPKELAARTELSKIYQQQKKWQLAEDILKEEIVIAPDALHPRTELSKIYQQQKKWQLAEDILKEEIVIAPDALHPRTELSKIYQQQKKWQMAEDILKELLELDKENLQARTELSKIYQQQKKWQLAEDILKELLELNKENLQARTELSKIYQQQKKWQLAEDILKELLELDKENLQARTELSKIYQQQKKWQMAEDILKEEIVIAPEALHPRTELSKIYQQQKKWDEAIKYLKEYIALEADGLHPRTELSKIYQQQKKWQLAEDILKELLELDKENLQARTELSKIYQQQKKWQMAEDILKESLAIDPEQLHPRTELSKIYQQQKKWQLAEDILNESLVIDPLQLHPRTELSKIYQRQKKWQMAEDILKELLELDKKNLQARTELSKIYQQHKKWQMAEDILKESLVIDPEQLHPRTELSKIYQQQKKWQLAEDILKESLAIDPEQLHPRTELSKIYQQQKKWQMAEDILNESLVIDPLQLHPRTELSKIYQQQKKWQMAEDILKESLVIDPEQLHPRTELSKIYQQQRKWYEAIKYLKEYIALEPDGLHPRTELSKIYQQQKKWQMAEDILHESLVIDPEQLHPRTELSKIYQQQKKWAEAEGILNEALSIEPDNYIVLIEKALLYKRLSKEIEDRFQKTELRKKYQQNVVASYRAEPENAPTLMELASIFKNQRQYRAALFFLGAIERTDDTDLECIRVQESIYGLMNNLEMVDNCRKKGLEIIQHNPIVRFRDRFQEQVTQVATEIKLVQANQKGRYRYIYSTKEMFIQNEKHQKVSIVENANTCRTLRNHNDAFFNIYLKDGVTVADCIEPYFLNAEDLIKAIVL